MEEFSLHSPSQQLASYLRTQLLKGRWSGTMPGSPTLARELSVDSKTVWAALGLLEDEGILVGQGTGRPRRITLPSQAEPTSSLRLACLHRDDHSQGSSLMIDLQHQLRHMGHRVILPKETLTGIGMKIPPLRKLVENTNADAWIISSGPRNILRWFAEQAHPAFALFGRSEGLPLGGVGLADESAWKMIARRLLELGHKRIVVLSRKSRRISGPGRPEQAIFDEMTRAGIVTGPYNFPDWKDTAQGLGALLKQVFEYTPPTALVIDGPVVFHAVRDLLARRGIHAPGHISLVCSDPDPSFAWLRPTVSHVLWDPQPVVERTLAWADRISRGIEDNSQSLTETKFIEGGTIGPPR